MVALMLLRRWRKSRHQDCRGPKNLGCSPAQRVYQPWTVQGRVVLRLSGGSRPCGWWWLREDSRDRLQRWQGI